MTEIRARWWTGDSKETWAPGEEIKPMTRNEKGHLDPIFQMSTGWYFCSETWDECYGPLPTEEECRERFGRYCDDVFGPKERT